MVSRPAMLETGAAGTYLEYFFLRLTLPGPASRQLMTPGSRLLRMMSFAGGSAPYGRNTGSRCKARGPKTHVIAISVAESGKGGIVGQFRPASPTCCQFVDVPEPARWFLGTFRSGLDNPSWKRAALTVALQLLTSMPPEWRRAHRGGGAPKGNAPTILPSSGQLVR